jgi:hypothetical protein
MKPALEVVLWWERRRVVFNLAVLTAGIVTVATVLLIGGRMVDPGEDLIEPLAMNPPPDVAVELARPNRLLTPACCLMSRTGPFFPSAPLNRTRTR